MCSTRASLSRAWQAFSFRVTDGRLTKTLDGRDFIPTPGLRHLVQFVPNLFERTLLLPALVQLVVNPLVALVIWAGLRAGLLAPGSLLRLRVSQVAVQFSQWRREAT